MENVVKCEQCDSTENVRLQDVLLGNCWLCLHCVSERLGFLDSMVDRLLAEDPQDLYGVESEFGDL